MATDDERREVARRLRETGEELGSAALLWYHIAKILGVRTATDGKTVCGMLADLIEPSCDLGPSGWTSFDERPPEPRVPVFCKGKNGACYVGKPVTFNGECTGKVWVPRGGEYRSPAAWRPVDYPPCDRDALLALAVEMARLAMSAGHPYVAKSYLTRYASRIREACGEGAE